MRARSKRGNAYDGLDHRFYLKDSDHRITWNQHRLVDADNAVHGPPEAPTSDLLGPDAESQALIDLMDFEPVQPPPFLLGGSPGRGGGGAGPSHPPPTDLVARLQAQQEQLARLRVALQDQRPRTSPASPRRPQSPGLMALDRSAGLVPQTAVPQASPFDHLADPNPGPPRQPSWSPAVASPESPFASLDPVHQLGSAPSAWKPLLGPALYAAPPSAPPSPPAAWPVAASSGQPRAKPAAQPAAHPSPWEQPTFSCTAPVGFLREFGPSRVTPASTPDGAAAMEGAAAPSHALDIREFDPLGR